MKIALNIQNKIQILVLSATLLVFLFSLGYITLQSRARDIEEAKRIINVEAVAASNFVADRINSDINVARTIMHAFKSYQHYPRSLRDSLYLDFQKEVMRNHPEYRSVATSWELYHVDPEHFETFGRLLWGWYHEEGEIKELKLYRNMDGDDLESVYYDLKINKYELLSDPEPYSYTGRPEDEILSTNMSIPLVVDNQYIGLVGIDVDMTRFQNMIQEVRPYEQSYAFLLSTGLVIVAHPNESFLGGSVENHIHEFIEIEDFTQLHQAGEVFSAVIPDPHTQSQNYIAFAPVMVDGQDNYWLVGISVPLSTIYAEADADLFISIIIGIIGIIIIVLVTRYISREIKKPVNIVTQILNAMSQGKIDRKLQYKMETGDEFDIMGAALNTTLKGLNEKNEFAINIGKNHLDTELHLLSEEDILGKSLLDMRDDLKKAKIEEEKRYKDEQIRHWASEGYTKFSEVLRQDNNDLDALSFNIIKNLVAYVNANQGGVFILNDEESENRVLELKACYAFDRKKYLEKTIIPGEGLAGACFLEKKTSYIQNIPQDYISITSGLGGENPAYLLIVPLSINNEVFGVLELASFKEFEPHHIEFVEKMGENIAGTISSVKINLKTAILLEKSQQQAEEMRAQEEEMRQNMEELHATQEEMGRKSAEMQNFLKALNATTFMVEYDLDGNITYISDSYLDLLNFRKEQVLGKHHSEHLVLDERQKREYDEFWNRLKKGETIRQEVAVKVNNGKYWLAESYAPIFNENGGIVKFFKIAHDITHFKKE